ncbi:MAG: RNA methyltransferase [Pirellulales bacterium]
MPVELVSTLDDPRIAVYRDLPQSNLTRPSGLFIAEGWLVVERLVRSGWPIDSVLLDETFREELLGRLPADALVYQVPSGLISTIVGFRFHRGVLACGRRRAEPSLERLVRPAPAPLTAVVAADVNDPENMGCILRNSAAFGVDLVLASRRCADPFSRRVLRTSMGTVFQLPLRVTDDLPGDVERLEREFGVELAATVLDAAAESLYDAARPPRFGLVLGNEGHGIPPAIATRCRRRITLPMRGGTDSLNVGVASGIFLYHFTAPERGAAEG